MKPKLSPFRALQFHNYRLFFIAYLISRIGAEMQAVTLNWHIYQMTNTTWSLALIGLSRFIPIIVFSLIGGMVADIINRKITLIISQICLTFIALLYFVTTVNGTITPLIIYILVALGAIVASFDTPARQSILPSIIPKKYFINAVGLNTIMWQTAVVLGPSLAGFMIAGMGEKGVYLINTLCFLASIIALFGLHPTKTVVEKPVSFNLASIWEGLSFVKNSPIIYSTMLLDFFATFFASATVLLPVFAKDILKVGPQGLGILYAAPSLGAILAGLFVSSLGHIRHQGRILIISVFVYGLATVLFGITKSFPLALVFLALTGMGDVVSTIIRNTIRQLKTPDHLRGRMISVNMIFFMGGPQLGEAEAGILAALVGTPASVVVGGVGTLVATALIAILVPKLRKYHGDEVVV